MARSPRPLIAGNWKMNGLRADLAQIEAVRDAVRDGSTGDVDILVCPPATLIREACRLAEGTALRIGGQNCHRAASGAHTGDISAAMLVIHTAGMISLLLLLLLYFFISVCSGSPHASVSP